VPDGCELTDEIKRRIDWVRTYRPPWVPSMHRALGSCSRISGLVALLGAASAAGAGAGAARAPPAASVPTTNKCTRTVAARQQTSHGDRIDVDPTVDPGRTASAAKRKQNAAWLCSQLQRDRRRSHARGGACMHAYFRMYRIDGTCVRPRGPRAQTIRGFRAPECTEN
jgi:hypothetical protein